MYKDSRSLTKYDAGMVGAFLTRGIIRLPEPDCRMIARANRNHTEPGPRKIINFRFESMTPLMIWIIAKRLFRAAQEQGLRYSRVVGMPQGDSPQTGHLLAQAFVRASGLDCAELFMDELINPDGSVNRTSNTNQRVLVLKMLVGSGDKTQTLVGTLRVAGYEVTDVVVLIDRERGARPCFDEIETGRVELHSVFSMTDLLDHWEKDGLLGTQPTQLEYCLAQLGVGL